MKLAKVSEDLLFSSFDYWQVDREYAMPMASYLVHGFDPGSFFYSVLANDFLGAMVRSHPMNTVEALKRLANWIESSMPKQAFGSYDKVDRWLEMPTAERRAILEKRGLIFDSKEEMWRTLTYEYKT